MEKLAVFEVVKPQGIKGELKARILADGFFSVSKIKNLYDESDNLYTVKSIKDAFGGFAFIMLDGVLSRNDAELYRGKIFKACKGDIKKGANSYFISDLIGLSVYKDDEVLGVIENVIQSNVDMIHIKLKTNKYAYFPFLKILKPIVDLENKLMKVNGEKLDGVIYYEN